MLDILNGVIAGTALIVSLVAMMYVRHRNEVMHADNFYEEWIPDITEMEECE